MAEGASSWRRYRWLITLLFMASTGLVSSVLLNRWVKNLLGVLDGLSEQAQLKADPDGWQPQPGWGDDHGWAEARPDARGDTAGSPQREARRRARGRGMPPGINPGADRDGGWPWGDWHSDGRNDRWHGRRQADGSWVHDGLGDPAGANLPGRAAPAAAATPSQLEASWDGYRSEIVIGAAAQGAAAGERAPATVRTYDLEGNLVVTYQGTAFTAADGTLHIDARGAAVSGPWAHQWSPDSFAIGPYGQLSSLDDIRQSRTGTATVIK